jgi:TPR repeat protein
MGVTRDLYEAKMWLKKAERLNHPDASIALEEIRMRYGV